MKANTLLEDICGEIGFTATQRLVALVAGEGGLLYVPDHAEADHPVALAIGHPAWQRLVALWPRETVYVGDMTAHRHARALRAVAAMVAAGMGARDIGELLGVSERQVHRWRNECESSGIVPLVMRARNARRGGL